MNNEHELLLENWSKRRNHVGKPFVKDGIIDPNRWSMARPKVLFLLKEAYGDSPWDLREKLRESGHANGKIWRTAAYWCYACHYAFAGNVPSFPADNHGVEKAFELFLSSAIVNVKKSNGQNPSVDEELARYVAEDGDLIRRQVDVINPDVVISGNVWCWTRKHGRSMTLYGVTVIVFSLITGTQRVNSQISCSITPLDAY